MAIINNKPIIYSRLNIMYSSFIVDIAKVISNSFMGEHLPDVNSPWECNSWSDGVSLGVYKALGSFTTPQSNVKIGGYK